MTDTKPPDSTKALATASGEITREIAEWLRSLRKGWTQPLPEPLKPWVRLAIAGTGTFTWLVGVVLFTAVTEPRFANFIFASVVSNAVLMIMSIVVPLTSLWFGSLIAYVSRPSGPIRLFLEGLLLPAATLAIIALSMGRMPSAPPQPVPVPVERPNGTESVAGPEVEENTEGQ